MKLKGLLLSSWILAYFLNLSKKLHRVVRQIIHFFRYHHKIEYGVLAGTLFVVISMMYVIYTLYSGHEQAVRILQAADANMQSEQYQDAAFQYLQAKDSASFNLIHLSTIKGLEQKVDLAKKLEISHQHFVKGLTFFNLHSYSEAISEFSRVDSQDSSFQLAKAKIAESQNSETTEQKTLQSFDALYQKSLDYLKSNDYSNSILTASQALALVDPNLHFDKSKVADLTKKRDQAKLSLQQAEAIAVVSSSAHLRVPILMYHYIRDNPDPNDTVGFNLSVTPADFDQQMSYLSTHGYTTTDVATVVNALKNGQSLPARSIVLTFDDGYRDFYTTAFPILKKYNLHSEPYIVPGFLGGDNYMTWDMVREIQQSGLVTIASHTEHHVYLTSVNNNVIDEELVRSKLELQQTLGINITDFCYPYGAADSRVATEVQKAGYLDATTTQYGAEHYAGNYFMIPRVRVSGGESLGSFVANL